MCTISFIARQRGYLLAMNRDESLARAKGLPPEKSFHDGRTILSPSEPGGGTWIALNDAAVTFALINWYSVPAPARAHPVSRGTIVRSLAAKTSSAHAASLLDQLPLPQISPFRLIGIFPGPKEIREWRWDLNTLVAVDHAWASQQWISSGFDESMAQQVRTGIFLAALKQPAAGSPSWLRQLHRSHRPATGPFSICMHRAGAASISYTEVIATARRSVMTHINAAPCGRSPMAKIHSISSSGGAANLDSPSAVEG